MKYKPVGTGFLLTTVIPTSTRVVENFSSSIANLACSSGVDTLPSLLLIVEAGSPRNDIIGVVRNGTNCYKLCDIMLNIEVRVGNYGSTVYSACFKHRKLWLIRIEFSARKMISNILLLRLTVYGASHESWNDPIKDP